MLVSIGRQYRITDHQNDALRLLTEAYDIARTQSELRERDLPEALAERLEHGA